MTRRLGEEPFRILYANSLAAVPTRLLYKEIGLLLLEALTLGHAWKRRRMGQWLGFVAFGLVMETIGYAAPTHLHAQFWLQALHFLPLKELLFYPLTMYPSWLAVEKLRLPAVWQCAVAMSVLQHLASSPYDSFMVRRGFGWTVMDSSFPFADFDPMAWHGGVVAVFYGWIGMGLAAGVACAYARNRGLSSTLTLAVVGLSSLGACTFWAPYHLAKLLSCRSAWSLQAPGGQPLSWYGQCVRTAAVGDDWIWVCALGLLLCALVWALRSVGQVATEPNDRPAWSMFAVTFAYHCGLVAAYLACDARPWEVVPVWLILGSVAVGAHFGCHALQGGGSKASGKQS